MDFAAQLAKLERSANNARNNNSNNNNNNTYNNNNSSNNNSDNNNNINNYYGDSNNNNNRRRQQRPYDNNNNSYQQRNTRPRYNNYNYSNENNSNNNTNNVNATVATAATSSTLSSPTTSSRGGGVYGSNRGGGVDIGSSTNYNNNNLSSPSRSNNEFNTNTNVNTKLVAPLETMVRYRYNVALHPNDFIVPYVYDDPRHVQYQQPSSLSSSMVEQGQKPPKQPRTIPHICLLAITIDTIPYEHIWEHWANNCNNTIECYVSLVCHAKYPDRVTSTGSIFVKQRLLVQPPTRGRGRNTLSDPMYHTYRPEWGSIDITRAMIHVLYEGMRIGSSYYNDSNNNNNIPETTNTTIKSEKETNAGIINNNIVTSPLMNPTTAVELSIESLQEKDPRYTTDRYVFARPYSKKKKKSPVIDDDTNTNTCNESTTEEDDDDKIPPVDKFIFISETCLPVQTLDECCRLLFPLKKRATASAATTTTSATSTSAGSSITKSDDDNYNLVPTKKEIKTIEATTTTTTNSDTISIEDDCRYTVFNDTQSWVNGMHRTYNNVPKNKYEADQFGEISLLIPGQYRWKADQWLLLSRTHANVILNIDEPIRKYHFKLWNLFKNINASDEMYFPTALSLLGILQVDKNRVVSKTATNTKATISTGTTKRALSSSNTKSANMDATTTTTNQVEDRKNDDSIESSETAIPITTANVDNTEEIKTIQNKEENIIIDASPSGIAGTTVATTAVPLSTKPASTPAAAPPPPPKRPYTDVQHRPVTYTDWSEGMKNPASYTNGIRDFIKVAKKARQQGSIIARKFSLWPLSSTSSNNNNKHNNTTTTNVDITTAPGYISTEQWDDAMEKLKQLTN